MPLQPQSRLTHLPAELLLIIIHLLCEAHSIPSTERCDEETAVFSPRHVHALSLVCKHLRGLCISPLFSRLKVSHTRELRRLKTKCSAEPEFARLIRKLDLAKVHSPTSERRGRNPSGADSPYLYGPNILPAFLPCLESLEWLELDAKQIDATLLATINSHPTLVTVAIRDRVLESLWKLFSSTVEPLSKIRVHSVKLKTSFCFGLRCPQLHSLMGRRMRLAHLIVQTERNIQLGPGDLVVPGLETLDIGVYTEPTSPMSWLPAFTERHPNLQTIKFSGHGSAWIQNPDISFPLQFLGAMERESITGTVDLISFSISRTRSAASLGDWPVVHLEMEITKGAGVSALTIASSMAPRVSSLMVRMSRWERQPVHIDDLISSLCLFRCLRRLELHCLSRHLLFEGGPSWALPPPDPDVRPTSSCVIVHAALRWLTGFVAQRVSSLALVHITDEGYDFLENRAYSWSLNFTYQVQQNRELEVYGPLASGSVGYRFRKFKPLSSPPDPPFQLAPARITSTPLLPLPSKHTAK
ncbi:hypothetical protein K438DRAFT_1955944 [Mycena galopus ATCC 62051]|nr:hypothetical protein K438DRAFT_1955944 [Mycena galopus ATCC 62051]